MPLDAIVVGAGIFGSLITRALRRSGMEVLTVDAWLPEAGSPPAACLMRPSWFTSLGKDVFEPSLKKLDELAGVQELTFRVNSMTRATVQWCDPKRVMLDRSEVRTARVTSVVRGFSAWEVFLGYTSGSTGQISAKLVVIAAGIWTPLLSPEVQVTGQAGVAWLWPRSRISEPKIKAWAPYKQLVAFNRGDGLWVGDGTSVRNLDGAHRMTSRIRCQRFISESALVGPPIELLGYRPYVKDAKPCFFKQLKPGLWIATGGAKNGTIAAGWCADQIVRAVI